MTNPWCVHFDFAPDVCSMSARSLHVTMGQTSEHFLELFRNNLIDISIDPVA